MTSRPPPPGTDPAPAEPPAGARRSHALDSISACLRSPRPMRVLDFGPANQQNIDFVNGFGHAIYIDDLLTAFDYFFSRQEVATREFAPERIDQFLNQTFRFQDASCHAAFVWDALQFLPPQIAQGALRRLQQALVPGSPILAFFHPEQSGPAAPHLCRILDERHLRLTLRAETRPMIPFSTRAIESFFQGFESIKFFLTRENLQEVIARR